MDYFLESVATYMINNHVIGFKDITLVFPNRRSGVFFLNELKRKVGNKPVWSPEVVTINEFVQNYSSLIIADSLQLLSELFVKYKKISGSSESFDSFYSWGEILLSDFNDVDKYMVDAESVFINVKNFKDIDNQVDFLSEEQIDTLKRFFNLFDSDKSTKIKDEFLKIWEVMLPLYSSFKQSLIKKNIGYEGLVYKDALLNLQKVEPNYFGFEKVFFIGFNAITPIEESIFSTLKNLKLAFFFWDYDNFYVNNKEMEAGLFQRRLLKKFPPVEFEKSNNQLTGKKIKLIATPTNHGQVFSVSQILADIPNGEEAETAVVLADEQLLLPVIDGIPDNISDLNITMGFPISDSLSGSFIDLVLQLHLNSRLSETDGISFYYRQVISLMRHPFLQQFCNTDSLKVIENVTKENLYYIKGSELQNNNIFKLLFKKIGDAGNYYNYFELLLVNMHENLLVMDNPSQSFLLEREFMYKFYVDLKKLHLQLIDFNLKIQYSTYSSLMRKLMSAMRVPFEGEPVMGLQVMGFLETRNLDFKNVIIMSMNEGVIPGPGRITSFIPYGLRRGFGLPTSELNDAMYAYYFYRLLQGTENVWLLYNSGAGGMSNDEKSRLIYQLEYDNNFKVETEVVSQSIELMSNREIIVEKSDSVWNRMQEYFKGEKPKYLSPSALSIYLQCPLRFYFKSVAKIKESDEIEEVVDARLFGNIFHKAAEKIYTQAYNNKLLVTKEVLNEYLKDISNLDSIIIKSFAEVFFGDDTKRNFTIEGKNQIIFDVIKKYLVKMLEKDKQYTPFSIAGLEKNVSYKFDILVNSENYTIEVGGQIDRLDRSDRGLRVIDYKTGADKLTFGELDDVFNPEKIRDTKAIFQTFIYSCIVNKDISDEPSILPMVYQVKKLFEPKEGFEITSKYCTPFQSGNFVNIHSEVENHLVELLKEIFDKNTPFIQTEDIKTCEYCPYKNMCGR